MFTTQDRDNDNYGMGFTTILYRPYTCEWLSPNPNYCKG